MSDTTRIFVPDGGNNDFAAIAAMNGGMGGAWNNPIWALAFLGILGNGFGGWGGNGGYQSQLSQIQDTLNTNQGNALLMNAITGNGTAVKELASLINCDYNAVQGAINMLQQQIANKAAQDGTSYMQIVNAINNGDASLASTLQSCCCDVKNTITNLNYEGRLADQAQTAFLGGKIDAQTTLINDKFCQLEMRSMQDKLNAERDKNLALTNQLSQEHQSALFSQQISQAVAPIIATQNAMLREVDDIKCKLPKTVTVPSSEGVLVPSCVAWNAALYGGGFPFGNFQGQGNVFS